MAVACLRQLKTSSVLPHIAADPAAKNKFAHGVMCKPFAISPVASV